VGIRPLRWADAHCLLFFPGIIQQGKNSYLQRTGQTQQPFLDRWLLLTAAMFGLSAILYAARLGYTHRHKVTASPAAASTADGDEQDSRPNRPIPGA